MREVLEQIQRIAYVIYHNAVEDRFWRMFRFVELALERNGFRRDVIELDEEGEWEEAIFHSPDSEYALTVRYYAYTWRDMFAINIITRREAEKRLPKVQNVWVWPGS